MKRQAATLTSASSAPERPLNHAWLIRLSAEAVPPLTCPHVEGAQPRDDVQVDGPHPVGVLVVSQGPTLLAKPEGVGLTSPALIGSKAKTPGMMKAARCTWRKKSCAGS